MRFNRGLVALFGIVAMPFWAYAEMKPTTQRSLAVEKKVARLFILSGQSNAGGNGNGELLSAEEARKDPEVLIYRAGPSEVLNQGLEVMAPGELKNPKEKFKIDRLKFGPELFFSKEIKKAYPDDIIVVAKVATRGGTSIVAWEKDHDREGWMDELKSVDNLNVLEDQGGKGRHLYNELIEGVNAARRALEQRDDVKTVIISGFVWVQNENDGKREDSARNYKRNLTNLINNVRADLNAPEMPVLYMDVHQPEPAEFRQLLSRMMHEVAAEVSCTAVVSPEGLSKYEGVHFDTEGMKGLGRRFAEAHLKMVQSSD